MTLRAKMPTSTMTTPVDSVPSPGIRRPSSWSYSGAVRPSTPLKIQISAPTLMSRGTVTKRPGVKLRRSHGMGPHHHGRGQRQPVPPEGGQRMIAQVPDEVLHRRVPDDRRRYDPDHDQ